MDRLSRPGSEGGPGKRRSERDQGGARHSRDGQTPPADRPAWVPMTTRLPAPARSHVASVGPGATLSSRFRPSATSVTTATTATSFGAEYTHSMTGGFRGTALTARQMATAYTPQRPSHHRRPDSSPTISRLEIPLFTRHTSYPITMSAASWRQFFT